MIDTSLSLLMRVGAGDADAWVRLDSIYRPLILGWMMRSGIRAQDAADLTQDVLFSLTRGIPRFRHSGATGSFRGWLRTITANRMREFWRAGRARIAAANGEAFLQAASELEDPASGLSAEWDREYDRAVLLRLLDQMKEHFDPRTLRAFSLMVLEGKSGAEAAAELGMTAAAVYMAKSRVLRRLREEASELLD